MSHTAYEAAHVLLQLVTHFTDATVSPGPEGFIIYFEAAFLRPFSLIGARVICIA